MLEPFWGPPSLLDFTVGNPTRTELAGVVRALRVGGLALGVHGGGPRLRERHFFPYRIPGGGLYRFGWGSSQVTRVAALFVLYRPGLFWLWRWRPTPLHGLGPLLIYLARLRG